jgi:hypothetical protein
MKKIFIPAALLITASLFIAGALLAELKIPAKAEIKVYWRLVPASMSPFDIKGKFTKNAMIEAVESPFGGGGIMGKQIVSIIKKNTTGRAILRLRALSLKNGDDPSGKPSMATIVVRDDESYYDNYIIKNKKDELAIYVDALTAE